MPINIEKDVFIAANPPKKDSLQIYFKKGKAHCCSRSVKVKNRASVSHQLYSLIQHINNTDSKSEKSQLAGIARAIYANEHKDYGCVRKIFFSLKNKVQGRGFHDENYFLNEINHLSPAVKKRKKRRKAAPKKETGSAEEKKKASDAKEPPKPVKASKKLIEKLKHQFAENELKTNKDRQNFENKIAVLSPIEIKALAKEQANPFRLNAMTYIPISNSKAKKTQYDESMPNKMEYIFKTLDVDQLKALIQGYFAKDKEENSISDWAFVNTLIGINSLASDKDRVELTKTLMFATKSNPEYLDFGTHCGIIGKKGKDYKAAIAFIQTYTRLVISSKVDQNTVNQRLNHLWNACSGVMTDALSMQRKFINTLDENQREKFEAWVYSKLDDQSIVKAVFLKSMLGI